MSSKNEASTVGGKTARACDNCVRKRARWYCAADDAFLCQSCDASVHSANPLARRHQRVLLKVSSSLKHVDISDTDNLAPSWHGGFKRKARTPRHGKYLGHPKPEEPSPRQMVSLVPELCSDDTSQEDNDDEQLLYRVPIYNPFAAELRSSSSSPAPTKDGDVKALHAGYGQDVDNLDVFLPSVEDLAEFAADVESLLGGGECYGMEGLGLMMECKEEEYSGKVKLEVDHMACHGGDADVDMNRETFELDFDYDSPAEEKVAVAVKSGELDGGFVKKKRKILLNLDYESVILEWASQGSPWTTGSRPEFDSGDCWPDCMGISGTEIHNHPHGLMSQHPAAAADGGREARVTRYREKRRTRLFSKKIRYEVRKLNAEKRPRMKGRFVKRASFGIGGPAGALPLLNH